jgi:glucosamine-6-phosphate deaminase
MAEMKIMQTFYGKTTVRICKNAAELGWEAARTVAQAMKEQLQNEKRISMVFSAAESQLEFLRALVAMPDLDWERVTGFGVDDFCDPSFPFEYTCAALLRKELAERVGFANFHVINHACSNPQQEAERYEDLLRQNAPINIACLGIGRSGHIALNEPGQTNLNDKRWVRIVTTDEASRKQLEEDPHFGGCAHIPKMGITLTIPAILSARQRFTMVPYASKKPVLTRLAQTTEPTPDMPASILLEASGTMYVDQDSCPDTWKAAAGQKS